LPFALFEELLLGWQGIGGWFMKKKTGVPFLAFVLFALTAGILFFPCKTLSNHVDGSYTGLGYATFKLELGF
jgi:hypothetical protein